MQLTTLGPFRLEGSAFTRPKPLLLLAYLALEGAKPRPYLAELFFPHAADPADALSSTLRRLRAPGEVIAVDGRLVASTVECDAATLLELASTLARPDVRLVTLHGPAGVGKTRLAIHAAHDQHRLGAFAGGVLFAELDAAERLPGLASYPEITILVTSRERLNLRTEWVVSVEGLAVPDDTHGLEEALGVDGLRLFVQRARRTDMTFRLEPADLPHARAICRRVGGLPLGLELIASWTRVMPLADIAEALKECIDVIDTERRDARPRRHFDARSTSRGGPCRGSRASGRCLRLLLQRQRRSERGLRRGAVRPLSSRRGAHAGVRTVRRPGGRGDRASASTSGPAEP